jgi:hypothetical protein
MVPRTTLECPHNAGWWWRGVVCLGGNRGVASPPFPLPPLPLQPPPPPMGHVTDSRVHADWTLLLSELSFDVLHACSTRRLMF